MTPAGRITRDAFADRLCGLEQADLAAFVAATFGARDWRVVVTGPRLVLSRKGDDSEERSVLVIGGGEPPSDVEIERLDVVIPARRSSAVDRLADDAGAVVFGPDDVYDLLLYGIDRETADALCREHLGRSVWAEPGERSRPRTSVHDDEADTGAGGDTEAGGEPVEERSISSILRSAGAGNLIGHAGRRRKRLVVGLALLIVLAVAVASASGGFGGTPFGGPGLSDGDGIDTATRTPGSDTASPTTGSWADSASATGATTNAGRMVAPTAGGTPDASTLERRYVDLTPTCERPPELVAVIIVGALRENDPATDDGIRTAWNFSSRASPGATYRSFASYLSEEQFELLYDHRRMEMTTTYAEHGDRAYRVSVTDSAGTSATYLVVLTKQQGGRLPGCWLLAGIVVEW